MAATDTPKAEKYRERAKSGAITHKELEAWAGKAKPGDSLPFGGNLQLEMSKAGTALWRTYYRIPKGGKRVERTYSHGPFSSRLGLPAVLKQHELVKEQARQGIDPVKARMVERAENSAAGDESFEAVAREWLADRKAWSKVHRTKSTQALELNVFPYIGRLPVRDITPAMVAKVVERMSHKADTASKVLQHVGRVFALAQTKGVRDNPAIPAREKLPERPPVQGRPAFLTWPELGEVLRGAERARLTPAVRVAHRLCAFTATRISNVVLAEWSEFDLAASPPLWIVPRAKMKMKDRKHDHKIILGPTIAAELRAWRSLTKGRGLVFPSPLDPKKPLTREALEKLYRVTLGLADRHTPHGWRSAFSTLAREEGGFEHDVVELALDHVHASEVVRAYDRGERLQQRIKLMTWWDGELAQAQRGAEVVPLQRAAKHL